MRSCFEGLHAAERSTCAQEGFYAYLMTRKGWVPEQIRVGIERGGWQKIDLTTAAEETSSQSSSNTHKVRNRASFLELTVGTKGLPMLAGSKARQPTEC